MIIIWAMCVAVPFLERVQQIAPHGGISRDQRPKIPRESHRTAAAQAMLANENVSEPKPADDIDTALSFTMEGFRRSLAPLIPYFMLAG